MSQQFETLLPQPGDGIRILEAKILKMLNSGGGAGGGNAQFVVYTSGTPSNPPNTSQPAMAYDKNGILPILVWNVDTQSWV